MSEIEKTKAEIKLLEKKLASLEEAEKQPDMVLLYQGKVDIVAYDKRTFYRIEYTDSLSGMYKWYEKEKTFYNLMPIRDNSDIFVLLEDLYQSQVIKQKVNSPVEDYNIKVVTDYLTGKARHKMNIVDKDGNDYKPTPQTHAQVEQGLRDAMKKAREDGVFDEPKPEPKSKKLSLKQLLNKWEFEFSSKWENPKNRNSELYDEELERFIEMFIEWLPATINDEVLCYYVLSECDAAWNSGYNNYRKNLMGKLGND